MRRVWRWICAPLDALLGVAAIIVALADNALTPEDDLIYPEITATRRAALLVDIPVTRLTIARAPVEARPPWDSAQLPVWREQIAADLAPEALDAEAGSLCSECGHDPHADWCGNADPGLVTGEVWMHAPWWIYGAKARREALAYHDRIAAERHAWRRSAGLPYLVEAAA